MNVDIYNSKDIETLLSEIRCYIYEKAKFNPQSFSNVTDVLGEEFVEHYKASDFKKYKEYRREQEDIKV